MAAFCPHPPTTGSRMGENFDADGKNIRSCQSVFQMQKSCQLKLAKVNSCNLCPDSPHSQDICKFTSHVLYFSYPILKPKYKVAHNVKNYLRELIFVTLAHSHWGETAEVCTKCTSFVKIFCYTHRSCFEKKI